MTPKRTQSDIERKAVQKVPNHEAELLITEQDTFTLTPPPVKPSQTSFDPSSFDDQPDGFKSKPVTSPNRSEEL